MKSKETQGSISRGYHVALLLSQFGVADGISVHKPACYHELRIRVESSEASLDGHAMLTRGASMTPSLDAIVNHSANCAEQVSLCFLLQSNWLAKEVRPLMLVPGNLPAGEQCTQHARCCHAPLWKCTCWTSARSCPRLHEADERELYSHTLVK